MMLHLLALEDLNISHILSHILHLIQVENKIILFYSMAKQDTC